MGTQHLNLKWRNHHSNLLSVFAQLLTTESFTDVTLVCDGASIRAHKVILSACSPFFHNIFSQHPCQNPIIILKDVAHKDLKVLVDFMYSGEVNIAQEYLPSFLRTAESLKIKGLSDNESSSSCSSALKRNAQSDSPSSSSSKTKRRRNSRNYSEGKSDDDSIYTPEGSNSRKENSPVEGNISNNSECKLTKTGAKDQYRSPMQRYEQSYNWGVSTESSKYVEVNLNDDDTNITGRSAGQDDSTTDFTGADTDSTLEVKPLPGHEELAPDLESLRQLHRATGLMSTVAVHYPGSPASRKEFNSSTGPGDGTENSTFEKGTNEVPLVETGHVLTRLPRHKKKDCIVCGNRQAGQRRRSRQWCPGCNVGVHVHCFAKLEHYRRSNKRTVARIEDMTISASPEMVQIKCEPFSETNAESNAESDAESNAQNDVETINSELG